MSEFSTPTHRPIVEKTPGFVAQRSSGAVDRTIVKVRGARNGLEVV